VGLWVEAAFRGASRRIVQRLRKAGRAEAHQ
jgi:hypothetical protein